MDPISLSDIFDTVQTVALSGGRLTDVKLDVVYPENDAYIECRRVQLEQVLINLIGNAADAVSGKTEKWIRVDSELVGSDRIIVRVTDSGTGIPTRILEKIFLPFYTSKAVGKGTGMGLSISASIIEDHAGKLAYNPDSPNTQITIDLPLKSA